MMGGHAVLGSRGVLRVAGAQARSWLQGLVTNDVEALGAHEARFAALLSPQGKILFDFFVLPDGDGLLLDVDGAQAPTLAKRLALYKLRAAIEISDLSDHLAVAAVWGAEPPGAAQGRIVADPRATELGWRVVGPPAELEALGRDFGNDGEAAYEAHRIACGVPRGGVDFAWGDAFPHEANMDRLHGIDFRKGCYVGQEVVSRVEHRGLARKRVTAVAIEGPAPAPGSEIRLGDVAVGVMGSSAQGRGLALLRLDRVEGAAGTMVAGDARLTLAGAP
jgi:folate-binding protein YgfZ